MEWYHTRDLINVISKRFNRKVKQAFLEGNELEQNRILQDAIQDMQIDLYHLLSQLENEEKVLEMEED